MLAGYWFVMHGLGLRFAMSSGGCVMFYSSYMEHSIEGPAKSAPGAARRMGVALHCRKDVSVTTMYMLYVVILTCDVMGRDVKCAGWYGCKMCACGVYYGPWHTYKCSKVC